METPKAGPADVWVVAQEDSSGRLMYAPNLKQWLDDLTGDTERSVLGTWTIHFTTVPSYVHPDKFAKLVEESADIPVQYTLHEDFAQIASNFGYRGLT